MNIHIINNIINQCELKKIYENLNIDDFNNDYLSNPLFYINTQIKYYKDQNIGTISRNHPRIREISGLVEYDSAISKLNNGSYNYSFFKDTINNTFHIAFGHVTSCMELGVKHSIISKGFPIYFSGELKKNDNNIQFNLNSSNFSIKKLIDTIKTKKSFNKKLSILFITYKLNYLYENKKLSTYLGLNKEKQIEICDQLSKFFNLYIRPIIIDIFNFFQKKNDNQELNFEYVIGIQAIYNIFPDKKYFIGLHDCYKNNILYNENFITEVNSKGLAKKNKRNNLRNKIYGMYIYQNQIKNDCDDSCKKEFYNNYYQTYNNFFINMNSKSKFINDWIKQLKIELLDDLFIQLIYQIPSFKNKKILFNENDSKNFNNLSNAITKLKLYNENDFKNLNNIKKIYKIWFSNYLRRNEIYYIYNNIYWDNPIKITKLNTNQIDKIEKDINIKKNFELQLTVIKLLFFSYFKLKIKEYSKCRIDDKNFICYRKKNINYYNIYISINDKNYDIIFNQMYIIYISIEDLYYDPNNTEDKEYTTSLIDFIEKNVYSISQKSKFTSSEDEELKKKSIQIEYVNINNLLEKNPIPIEYISSLTGGNPFINNYIININEKYEHFNLNMKYLKYKAKYLNIKNFTIQKINKEYSINELTDKYLKYKTKYQLKI